MTHGSQHMTEYVPPPFPPRSTIWAGKSVCTLFPGDKVCSEHTLEQKRNTVREPLTGLPLKISSDVRCCNYFMLSTSGKSRWCCFASCEGKLRVKSAFVSFF
ncbi:uncharacterized protein V6R79_021356 [Siganus canaliculatus]